MSDNIHPFDAAMRRVYGMFGTPDEWREHAEEARYLPRKSLVDGVPFSDEEHLANVVEFHAAESGEMPDDYYGRDLSQDDEGWMTSFINWIRSI